MGRLPGESQWTAALAGMDLAGMAEILCLDGVASTSLVGANINLNTAPEMYMSKESCEMWQEREGFFLV